MIFLIGFGTLVSVFAHVEYEILPLFLGTITRKNFTITTGSEHLAHHKYFNCNYGFAKYLDIIFNTYKQY